MIRLLEKILAGLGLGESDYIGLACGNYRCDFCLACDHHCHAPSNPARRKK